MAKSQFGTSYEKHVAEGIANKKFVERLIPGALQFDNMV